MRLFDLLRKQEELETRLRVAEAELDLLREAANRASETRENLPYPSGQYL